MPQTSHSRKILQPCSKKASSCTSTPDTAAQPEGPRANRTLPGVKDVRKMLMPRSRKLSANKTSKNTEAIPEIQVPLPNPQTKDSQADEPGTYRPTCVGPYHELLCGHIIQTVGEQICGVNCVHSVDNGLGFNCPDCAGLISNVIDHQLPHAQKLKLRLAALNKDEARCQLLFSEYVVPKVNVNSHSRKFLFHIHHEVGRTCESMLHPVPVALAPEPDGWVPFACSAARWKAYNKECAEHPELYDVDSFAESSSPSTTASVPSDCGDHPTATQKSDDELGSTPTNNDFNSLRLPVPGKRAAEQTVSVKRMRTKIEVVIDPLADSKSRGSKHARDTSDDFPPYLSTSWSTMYDGSPQKRRVECPPVLLRNPQFLIQRLPLGRLEPKRKYERGFEEWGKPSARPEKMWCNYKKPSFIQDANATRVNKRKMGLVDTVQDSFYDDHMSKMIKVC